MEGGAHALDVCVALTERSDEAEKMRKLVKKLALKSRRRWCIDSTEADVLEARWSRSPGRAIVNSINMENGREQDRRVMPLVVEHGAAVIALTIDEEGMAKTRERKLEVAQRDPRDRDRTSTGSTPEALIFDALTFTLATGDEEFAARASRRSRASARSSASCPAC